MFGWHAMRRSPRAVRTAPLTSVLTLQVLRHSWKKRGERGPGGRPRSRSGASAAVIEAFASGVVTTGAPPLGLLLDNKLSNHMPDVDDAIPRLERVLTSDPGMGV